MRHSLCAAFLGVLAVAPIACNNSPEGGTPGSNDLFRLVGGIVPIVVKPGDAVSVKFIVVRKENFHQSIRLVTRAPDLIAANLDRNLVKEGESAEVNVRLRPQEHAAPGEYKVQVLATADTSPPFTLELTVRVVPK